MRANACMAKGMMFAYGDGRRKRGRSTRRWNGGNNHDVIRDESGPGGGEGCGGGSGLVEKTITMTIARALRVDSTR